MGGDDRKGMSLTRQQAVVWPLSSAWVARGVLVIMVPEPRDAGLPHQDVAVAIRAGLWIATAIAAAIIAFKSKRKAIPLLMVMPAFMATSYLFDGIDAVTPPNPPGSWTALPWLVYWASMTVMLWVLSGWRALYTDVEEGHARRHRPAAH